MTRHARITTQNAVPLSAGAIPHPPSVDHYLEPLDISADWDDPEAPDATVKLYFDINPVGDGFAPAIKGMSYDDGHGPIYYNADRACRELGRDRVMDLEEGYATKLYDEELPDGYAR